MSTDDNFEFDENGRMFSKRVENTVGKGEIARYKQFLLSHGVLKRLRKNQDLFGKGLSQVNILRQSFAQTCGNVLETRIHIQINTMTSYLSLLNHSHYQRIVLFSRNF